MPENRHRIFVSYSTEDTDIARRILHLLQQTGGGVGRDSFAVDSDLNLAHGDVFKVAVRSKIAASSFLVILLSPSALQSKWVKYELETALGREWHQRAITVVPVKVRPCEIPPYMAPWTVIDATHDLNGTVDKLVELLVPAQSIDFDSLDWRRFEDLVEDLLKAYGFKDVAHAEPATDAGYDLKAFFEDQDPFGRSQSAKWLVQVKATKQRTDLSALHEFLDTVKQLDEPANILFVTSSQITSAARKWLEATQKLIGLKMSVLEGTDLKRLILSKPDLIAKYFGERAEGDRV